MENFYERLNQIEDRLKSRDFLNSSGLGNEIGFYIFDYPPERELEVRRHVDQVINETHLKIVRVNLFEAIVNFLKEENILEPAIEMQRTEGDAELTAALKGIIEGARIAPLIIEKARPQDHDVVLITGVGNTYPLLRTHDLLNNLQALMRNKPLVVFYPGKYTGQSLSLFGELKDENYYRAFRLVS